MKKPPPVKGPIVFSAPTGYNPGEVEGSFEALATLRRNEEGRLVLVAIDGHVMDIGADEQLSKEPESLKVEQVESEPEELEKESGFLDGIENRFTQVEGVPVK